MKAHVAALTVFLAPVNRALPHLSRQTLIDLQRNQHEKSCLLFVRAQDPSELALVPCMLSAVDKRGQRKC